MREKSKSRFCPRAGKRKNEFESSSTSEPKSKRGSKKNECQQKVYVYCWLCHTEANDLICVTCQRAFHSSCLDKASASFSELGVCPECQCHSVNGTELNSSRFLNLDKLTKMLDVLTRRVFEVFTRRSFDKKREKNELNWAVDSDSPHSIFFSWPEEDRDKLFKIIDFEILLDHVHHNKYIRTAEFYGDVKYILHNASIAYGANSDQAKAAENLRRDFKTELTDLEACPECYYYLYCNESRSQNSFVRLCDTPHDIVWAQLTGHPYWPAKCLKVIKGIAHVRFFGEHEQSNIPIGKCLCMSESHPKFKNSKLSSLTNSGPKSQRYKSAKSELLEYIHLFRRKFGDFPFYPHKTSYKPHEKQNEVVILSTEGGCNKNTLQMKLEDSFSEDSEMDVINPTIVDPEGNLTFENTVTNDIPTPIGSGTEKQCPTLAQITPSLSPCQGSGTSEYPTFDELDPCIDPSLSPGNDNLNRNPSVVTSINMTFSTDENNVNIENANPVVSSVDSVSPIDTASSVLSSPSESFFKSKAKHHQKCKRFLHDNGPEVTETVASTEIQAELDDEVHYIGQQRGVEGVDFNPDIVLPVLMEENPELRNLVQSTRYFSDAMIVRLYANLSNNLNSIGKISKLSVKLRKCRSELKKALEEIDKMRKEAETNRSTVNKLETDNRELQVKLQLEKTKNQQATNNAKLVIKGLKSGCSKRIEEAIKAQYLSTINEKEDCILKKDKQLRDAEDMVKNADEEIIRLRKELGEIKVEILRNEEKLKAAKLQISPDTIREYKQTHYCCICERSAAIVCCLNTSYCGLECKERHSEEHKKHCENKVTSQSFVQQRVISQQSVVMVSRGVITSGRSAVNSSSTAEVPETNSTMSSTHHKKHQIHHVSASPLLPTPHYHASSSRSYPSRGKRRSLR